MLTVEQKRAERARRADAARQEALAKHRRRLARMDELEAEARRIALERHDLAPVRAGIHNPAATRDAIYERWLKSPIYDGLIEAMARLTPEPKHLTAARRHELEDA